jgi:hypothetical protein
LTGIQSTKKTEITDTTQTAASPDSRYDTDSKKHSGDYTHSGLHFVKTDTGGKTFFFHFPSHLTRPVKKAKSLQVEQGKNVR